MVIIMSQFQNSSKLSKRPRFDLRKGAFSPVALQAAGSNYPLQLFANGIFAIFRMTFEITSFISFCEQCLFCCHSLKKNDLNFLSSEEAISCKV